MKILHTTPAQDGFYMPAEFAPHEGCLMIWPERADSWQYGAYAARKAFLRVIETISESESMTVLCSEGQYDNERAQLPDRVRLVVMETDDAWARDVGPTFVINGRGERRGIDWGFNAWGGDVDGLYPSWEKDNRVARKFCDLVSNDVYDKRDFICEGGSIHSDGEGTALVTEACLLSAGRNPDLTKTQIEQVLCDYLGVSKVIWLPRGIYNDETNEHVDNVCAFTAPGEVVLAWTDDETDPQRSATALTCATASRPVPRESVWRQATSTSTLRTRLLSCPPSVTRWMKRRRLSCRSFSRPARWLRLLPAISSSAAAIFTA